jgi:hypothetical protein
METFLAGAPMGDWYAHVDMAAEVSNSVMGIRLVGLTAIGGSSLRIMNLGNKLMLFVRTQRCLMTHLGA